MKPVFILTLAIILFFPSCQKEKGYNLTEKEKLLTSHGWNFAYTIRKGQIDYWRPWWQDDCWVFRPDGTFNYSVGTEISPSLEEDSKGTWYLSADEMTIYCIYSNGGTTSDLIVDISKNKLILTGIPTTGNRIFVYNPC